MRWRLLLRIARRDALRSKARSLLIVAMVALPVFAMSGVDVVARTAQVGPVEAMPSTLGAADAFVRRDGSAPVQQSPDGQQSVSPGDEATTDPDPAGGVPLASLLPAGSRVIPERSGSVTVRGREEPVHVDEVPYTDPMLAGIYRQVEGRAPVGAGEVAVSPASLELLGVTLGGRLELTKPAGVLTVVGTAHRTRYGQGQTASLVTAPGTMAALGVPADPERSGWVDTPEPLTWERVLALNEKGVVATSRAVLLDPPPDEQVPYSSASMGYTSPETVAFVLGMLLAVGLAALEVVLLAGTAFAVGTRRQARALALLAASGAEPRHVRGIVLAGGVVLGLAGAVLGTLLGTGVALGAIPVVEHYSRTEVGPLDLRPLELLGIAVVGLVTGVLAAVLPARTAARQDVVRALSGRRGTVRTPRKVPAIGLAVSALGVGLAALGSAMTLQDSLDASYGGEDRYTSTGALLLVAGAGLAQVGLIVASPAIVGAAARLARFLPLTPRLALRDAGRHRGRSAPAVAAVMTAVAGSLALTCYVAALDDKDRRQHSFAALPGQAVVGLGAAADREPGTDPAPQWKDPQVAEAAAASVLPVRRARLVPRLSVGDCTGECWPASVVVPEANACPVSATTAGEEGQRPTPDEVERHRGDWRCTQLLDPEGSSTGGYPRAFELPVGDATLLRALTGTASPAAEEALAAGGVVVFDRQLLHQGRAELLLANEEAGVSKRVRLPAAHLPIDTPVAQAFLSQAAAQRLEAGGGGTVRPSTLLLDLERLPTEAEEATAGTALGAQGLNLTVERGYVSNYGLGLLALVVASGVITLGAAGIATGLAGADARPDHATLAAVGAAPRIRRLLAMAQAGTIAGLGTVLGVAVGFVPAVAFLGAIPSLRLIVPWPSVLAILLGVPLLAALAAGLFTRSRFALDRRIA